MGPLEKQLVLAVHEAKEKNKSKRTTFTLLLLSFHKMHEGFAMLSSLLVAFQDMRASESGTAHATTTKLKGKVRASELERRIKELRMDGGDPIVAETLKALKEECAGMNKPWSGGDVVVDLDEFILFWTVVHLRNSELVKFQEIKDALLVVESAFLSLDYSNHGMLERRELAEAMRPDQSVHHVKRIPNAKGGTGAGPADRLFKHFDLDKSGAISFKEFLLGLFTIVMDEEIEIEEEEEEEMQARTSDVQPIVHGH